MRDIVVKGEHIVHGIYITVIVILAVALIFKSSDGSDFNDEKHIENSEPEEEEDTVQMLKNASVTIIKNTNPKSSSVTPPQTTNSNTQTTPPSQTNDTEQNETEEEEEPEEELLPITGQVELTIDKVTTEVKGEDWAKIVKIEFTIKNQKIPFYPKILAYLWDDNDEAEVRNYIEEEIYLSKSNAGEMITEEKEVSISYNEIDEEKTLKLVLEDEDEEELDFVIYKFTT
jgi:hypothetical protein